MKLSKLACFDLALPFCWFSDSYSQKREAADMRQGRCIPSPKPLASPGKPGPQWNTLDITLDGSRTIVLLNEVEVTAPSANPFEC
jgi:hypothetical protein